MRWRDGGVMCAALAMLLLSVGCAANRSSQPAGGPPESPQEAIELVGDSLGRHWHSDLGGARALWFKVRCLRNVGVFAELEPDTLDGPADTLLAHYFAARRRWLGEGGLGRGALPQAIGISAAWYPWALIAMPDTAAGAIRLTWITHDAPDPQLQQRPMLPERPPAILRAEQRLADPEAPAETPAERPPVTLQRQLQALVLGSATVDLSTGKIIRRTGAVR